MNRQETVPDDHSAVTIIMATYNGGGYLKEQLDSIINQSWKNWQLYVRDDGSSDETMAILSEYEADESRIKVLHDDKGTLGICLNFAELMQHCAFSKYLMFSDQDDIWLPEKVARTLDTMRASEALYGDVPILVHSDLCLVDEQLRVIDKSAEKYINLDPHVRNKLGKLLAQNYVYGCTIMLNKHLVDVSLPVPCEAENHDYWVSLIAASVGRMVYLPAQYILYRQHRQNFSGGISGGTFINRLKRMTMGWQSVNDTVDIRIRQAYALRRRVGDALSARDKKMLDAFLACASSGGPKTVLVSLIHGISRQGALRTLIFYLSLLKRRNIEVA